MNIDSIHGQPFLNSVISADTLGVPGLLLSKLALVFPATVLPHESRGGNMFFTDERRTRKFRENLQRGVA